MSTVDEQKQATDEQLLQTYLADRDVPCPRCGYNLRTLAGRHCPECGEQLRIHVGLVHPKLKAMIAGLMGLVAGAGLSGLLLIYAAYHIGFSNPRRGFIDDFVRVNAIGFFILGSATVAWLIGWRRLYRLPTSVRVILAIGCWALTFTFVAVFTHMIE
ncbi:MAG: hypothetical protein WDZ31_01850 [Phycisphaeraceae bacterium]